MIHTSLSFVFFGTDDFSVAVLEELKKAGFIPALIVTAPDRPKGRGLVLTPPPVKLWALRHGIPILQPETLDSAFNLQLTTDNLQLGVVTSYGIIISKQILDIPRRGMLNVHPSLLPKYRGATPLESQILAGEKEMGVTIMLMDEGVDHGPIVAQRTLPLSVIPAKAGIQVPTASELRKKLSEEGGKLLAEVMLKWVAGEIKAIPQDHSKATYTKKFTKADGEINLSDDPYRNFLKIQAFESSIGTYFYATSSSPLQRGGAEGGGVKKVRVLIKSAEFKDGKLIITRVIPEGKKEMSYVEFLRSIR